MATFEEVYRMPLFLLYLNEIIFLRQSRLRLWVGEGVACCGNGMVSTFLLERMEGALSMTSVTVFETSWSAAQQLTCWVPSQVFSFGTPVANVWKWSLLIWGKITVEVLFQHRNNNENCLTGRKTVQCPCPVNQIGALKFVTPQWSTPEMLRMTAFLRFPRAAAWPSCSCTSTSTQTAKCRAFAQSHADFLQFLVFLFFFSLLDHGSPHTTHTDHDDDRWSFYTRSRQMPGSQVFILVFDVPSPKCFAQTGDRHSCQAGNTGSALKIRKEIFKKYSWL